MSVIRLMPPLLDFGVILFILFKTLNTKCFAPSDINLSLIALVFSILAEIYLIKAHKN